MNRHKNVRRATTVMVFEIIVTSTALTALILFLVNLLIPWPRLIILRPILGVCVVLGTSAVLGACISIPLTNFYIKPLSDLMKAMNAVAKGDYTVRIERPDDAGEFGRCLDSFNTMAESLGSVEILGTDFINTISHEFKTPVASIAGFAKLLQGRNLTAEQQKLYTDTIIQQSQRLSAMSANILLLSRYESTDVITGKEPYSLDEQLRECIHLQERAWLQKNILMNGELESVTYCGNRDFMIHLWSNLLSNAIKYTPQGGEITVRLFRRDDRVVVSFRDSGIGMDEETLRHIFEKFYQADDSRHTDGNGLGLSIVRRIVSLCGGEITVSSQPGVGSEFTVTLPAEAGDAVKNV